VNPKVVSERLGHHSVAFTVDTYAHALPGMQAQAASLFASLRVVPDRTYIADGVGTGRRLGPDPCVDDDVAGASGSPPRMMSARRPQCTVST
jgi:hypothetical protein